MIINEESRKSNHLTWFCYKRYEYKADDVISNVKLQLSLI